MSENLLQKIKLSLRIRNSTKFDDEILEQIESAKLDLNLAGVYFEKYDSLIIQAIKYYCRANFALDNKDSLKFALAYESLKDKLSLCKEYQKNG